MTDYQGSKALVLQFYKELEAEPDNDAKRWTYGAPRI